MDEPQNHVRKLVAETTLMEEIVDNLKCVPLDKLCMIADAASFWASKHRPADTVAPFVDEDSRVATAREIFGLLVSERFEEEYVDALLEAMQKRAAIIPRPFVLHRESGEAVAWEDL